MRILVVAQYFPPEVTAGAIRVHAFASGLARLGHDVEVICGIPNHPAGVVPPEYRGHLLQRREMEGVRVRYAWVHATPSKTVRARLLNYASFAFSGALGGVATRRADVIVASSPPLSVGSVGALLAARHRAPWVLDIRDIWPDAAVALGQIRDGPMLRFAQRLERRLYRRASAITVTTEPFRARVEARGGGGKTTVIPNGTTPTFLEAGNEPPDPSLLPGADGRFSWTYAGNVGLVAGLDVALEAAGLLGDGFRLVIVGDGPRREELRQAAAVLPQGSVSFRDPVPPPEAAKLMRASDALLASRAPNPGLDDMVLSKLYDCCAVGRPVVVSAGGETARLAAEADAALCIEAGDAQGLAAAIRGLRDDPALRDRLSERGRAFALANSREEGVRRLEKLIRGLSERAN